METRANLTVGIIGSTVKAVIWVALVTLALGAVGGYAFAQQPATPAAADDKVLSKDELNALVGKIALYPDDLVAIVLPASTYPLQVVEAERFLQERQKDPSLKPSDKWDDSVVALLNYPEVVKLMNDDLDWTWKLGDAVINQRGAVLDAIQNFRGQAEAAGNLHTDDHQVVQNDDQGDIQVKPADPQVVYVPYYDPQEVVVQQPAPAYYYYPYGYPLYYYPYPYGYPFAAGYFWGVTTAFVIGWHSHYVHVVHCGYPGHPYYGHTYYGAYYARHDTNAAMSHGNYVWEPHYRTGAQPFTRSDGRQLAVAHHDPNAGGAPSAYHSVDRGTANASGYRAGSSSVVRSNWHDDGHGNTGYAGHGNDGHANNGYAGGSQGSDGHANNGHGNDSHGNNGYSHGNDGYGAGHANAGFRDAPESTGSGGTKQIQPIRNDSPTQAAIRSELRDRAPNHSAFTSLSSTAAHSATPSIGGRSAYPSSNQSSSSRGVSPQFGSPQSRNVPQAYAPQVRTMPSAPRQGGASYVYRSPSYAPSMPQASMARPSMPQASAGHAPSAHQGGGSHGGQGHGGGGGHGSR